jgi:hypothetical protein
MSGKSIIGVAVAIVLVCGSSMAQSPSPKRDINAVLADHQQRLMRIPGVVGVYVGAVDDGRTLCLKVMLASDNAETRRALPKTVEGYSIVAEVTGEVRPLGAERRR